MRTGVGTNLTAEPFGTDNQHRIPSSARPQMSARPSPFMSIAVIVEYLVRSRHPASSERGGPSNAGPKLRLPSDASDARLHRIPESWRQQKFIRPSPLRSAYRVTWVRSRCPDFIQAGPMISEGNGSLLR